jgi:hypothetical protein
VVVGDTVVVVAGTVVVVAGTVVVVGGTVVVVGGTVVVVVVTQGFVTIAPFAWHTRHAGGFPWGVAINGHASPPEWHPAQVDEFTLPAAGAPEWQAAQLPVLNP